MSDPKTPASRWLKSTQWLADNLGKVVVVDATYYLPTEKRDARADYTAAHIPGAVFFDIEAVSDTSIDLPHMGGSSRTWLDVTAVRVLPNIAAARPLPGGD